VQAALRQSEERFSKAFASSPVGLSISTLREGRIIDANDAYKAILGYSRDEIVGKRSEDLRLFADPADRASLVAALDRGGSVKDVRVRARRSSGELIDALISMVPIELEGEACLISSVVDITERLRAEEALRESEERYRGLFENMVEGFAYCRMEYEDDEPSDFTYLAVNPAFVTLIGISGVVGKKASEIVPGSKEIDRDFFAAYERVARERRPDRFEVEVLSLGLWLSISVYFPRPGFFVAVFDVITARKEAEAEIRALNAELEDRVRRRTAQLEGANAELEAFSYSVSHDLRAPLRGVDGWSAAIEEEFGPSMDAKARDYLARVRSESRRMGSLIDSLLQLAKVGRAEMSRESIDLSELAASVAARMREAYPGRAIEFRIESGLCAHGDRRLIEIALVNLFDNACKFTARRPDGGRIEFGRSADAAFYVRDNGAGFDMAYASKLFAPFQRMHKAADFPGTGIGLATVHRIIAKHGGRIWAEARPGEGASFRFTLEDDR
jgi:PAS domain S-box-containing protein